MSAAYRILVGDVLDRLRELPSESVHCVVTSPPYWGLRDYGVAGQIGLEAKPGEFLAKMTDVFREVRRVLRVDGTCWVNMGDSYANDGKWGGSTGGKHVTALHGDSGVGRGKTSTGLKPKDLVGMPWRLAFELQTDGWWLRQDIIWSKPNPMPESVTDRCTKAHEYLFLLTKSARYYYDAEAVKEAAVADHPAGNTSHKGATAYLDGDERHRTKQGLVAYASRNGKNALRGQGSNRDGDNGPALREGRDMSLIGVGGKRNKRSVWEIATEAFPEAHFATFPRKLVEPCILAGTSEKGCCGACGAPWARVTECVDTGTTKKMPDGMAVGNYAHGSILAEGRCKGEAGKPVTVERTIGWMPSCNCHDQVSHLASPPPVVPCTVLDPFNGSGTTGLVALANRCDCIGIELNPEYAAMAERRLLAASAQEVMAFA